MKKRQKQQKPTTGSMWTHKESDSHAIFTLDRITRGTESGRYLYHLAPGGGNFTEEELHERFEPCVIVAPLDGVRVGDKVEVVDGVPHRIGVVVDIKTWSEVHDLGSDNLAIRVLSDSWQPNTRWLFRSAVKVVERPAA